MEIPNHRVAGAEDRSGRAPVGIQPIQKGREPNAAGHGVQFSEHETFIRQQQIRSQHRRKHPAILWVARVLDQRRRLAAIQIVGDPRREERLVPEEILAGDRAQIERLQGLVKFEARRTDRFEFGDLRRRERPRFRRKLPRLVLEQRLPG